MTTQTKLPTALFPDIPRGVPLAGEDGMIHPLWLFYFDQQTLALQTLFKREGYVIPTQTATSIAALTGIQSNNNIVYDSTNNKFKGNIAGTWKTFTLT
jgi:hypothetical protein